MSEPVEATVARLCERSDSILRELARVSRQVETFAPLGGQLIEALAELQGLKEDLDEFRPELRKAVNDLTALKAEQGKTERALSRRQQWTIGVALLLIGAAVGIFVKLLGL